MLDVHGASVSFGGTLALDGVDLTVEEHETVCVLGPSGSGKSTLLRAIAGLEPLGAGTISWRGRDLRRVPPHRRGMGLMFQDHALFPHRDVLGNVTFGLRVRGVARERAATRAREVLALVGLENYERRAVHELSGGEQQRVALARALAPAPALLMLDEPLGSLDRVLRERLVAELRELFVRLGLTAIFVTHDQDEAFTLADRVIVLHRGRVEQSGVAAEVWARPRTEFVARFLGFANFVDAELVPGPGDRVTARSVWGTWALPRDRADRVPDGACDEVEGRLRLAARADALRLDPAGGIAARVLSSTYHGDHSLVRVAPASGGSPLVVAVAPPDPPPRPGTHVMLALDPAAVVPVTSGAAARGAERATGAAGPSGPPDAGGR